MGDRVLFTNEFRFSLNTDSHSTLIWGEPGTHYLPSNVRKIDNYGEGASHRRRVSALKRENEKLSSFILLCTQTDVTREIDYNAVTNCFEMIKAQRKPLSYQYNDSDSTKNKDVQE
ncbi:hypothetical protein TNCV_2721281 [Trichonephila clavipes]|nr:hypothetical protein TNCV_2721281 [Trichonephila clavipes]